MKKLSMIALALVLAFFVVLPLSAGGDQEDGGTESGKVYKLKLGTSYKDPAATTEFNAIGMAIQSFVDTVAEKTGGRVVIEPFYSRTLGGNLEMFEMVRRGELEFYVGQPMSGVDKRFGALSLPYLFKDIDEVKQLVCDPEGKIFKMVRGWLNENDAELLAVSPGVFRGFANAKRPVTGLADLKGLNVRIYQDPIVQAFWEEVAIPVQMSFGEVYTSLQTGIVDGMEFSKTGVIAYKIVEVTKYFTDIDWQWTFGFPVIASTAAWDKLPEDLQDIVTQCARDAMELQGELQEKDNALAVDKMKELGMEVHLLDDTDRQEFIDFSKTLEGKFKDVIGEETYNNIMDAVESVR